MVSPFDETLDLLRADIHAVYEDLEQRPLELWIQRLSVELLVPDAGTRCNVDVGHLVKGRLATLLVKGTHCTNKLLPVAPSQLAARSTYVE